MNNLMVEKWGWLTKFDLMQMGLRFTDLYSILDDFGAKDVEKVDKTPKTIVGNANDISKEKKQYI